MISIDGREVSKNVGSGFEYAQVVLGMTEEEYDSFEEKHSGFQKKLSQLVALVYSHKLLRHTSHACQSMTDAVNDMFQDAKKEFKEKYDIEFKTDQFNFF